MSNFTALNIAYEDESEEEIDDSKELQIEEALKLYQNALKLHSQGPSFYDQAEAAYKELLLSEVFSYAESLSESRWLELYGESELIDEGDDEDVDADLPTAITSGEGAPSTLPQVLYLAYKNYGLFRLDQLREQLLQIERVLQEDEVINLDKGLSDAAGTGLKNLAEALDRDESDLELWRKVARVGQFLGSQRISRFCLETVLHNDGSDPSSVEALSLEQAFASEQLRPLLVSIYNPAVDDERSHVLQQYQHLVKSLQKQIDPFPYLPRAAAHRLADLLPSKAAEQEIKAPSRSWAGCGAAILAYPGDEFLDANEDGSFRSDAGATYFLSIPRREFVENKLAISDNIPGSSSENQLSTDLDQAAFHKDIASESISGTKPPEVATSEDIRAEPTTISPKCVSPTSGLQNESTAPKSGTENQGDAEQDESIALGSSETLVRKRSSATAELADGTDVGRAKSKRIKARGSTTDPNALNTTAEDWSGWYQQQLEIYISADKEAFQTVGAIMTIFGCIADDYPFERNTGPATDELAPVSVDDSTRRKNDPAEELKTLLAEWDLAKSKVFLSGEDPLSAVGGLDNISDAKLSTFLTQATTSDTDLTPQPLLPDEIGIENFVDEIREQPWLSYSGLAFGWILKLVGGQPDDSDIYSSAYEDFKWPDGLKNTVCQLLVKQDEYIFHEIRRRVELSTQPLESSGNFEGPQQLKYTEERLGSLVQVIFELHLDIYSRISNSNSEVTTDTVELQSDRLSRWAALASTAMNALSPISAEEGGTQQSWQLMYRFMWASVVRNSLQDLNSSEITVTYFHDLIDQLMADSQNASKPTLVVMLPNNAIMPEVSVHAAEREISRLTTLEYFKSIFDCPDDDPVSVIEKLEPLLLLSVSSEGLQSQTNSLEHAESMDEDQTAGDTQTQRVEAGQDLRLLEALHFLQRTSLPMRLILWRRLQDAYSIINYPPQILTCNLWSLIIIVRHFESATFRDTPQDSRRTGFLTWLNKLDELETQILALVSTNSSAFECVDQEQLKYSMEAVMSLHKILHAFASWEDSIRVGQSQPTPQTSNAASKAQLKSAEKFRDMIVKTWTLNYILITEAMVQYRDVEISGQQLLAYIKTVHNVLGLRTYCGLANNIFLKLARKELLRMKDVNGWDTEMPQVIFDLYGLKISSAPTDMQDHSCESIDLDRSNALEILDLLLVHVNKLSIRELLKSDLRFAVDKMQVVIKVPRAFQGSARSFNKRLIIAYLKSPINPLALYRSIRGIGELCSMPVRTEGYDVAAKGWYFLLGHVALTKFRSQKRVTAGSVEDLESAKMFFRQDLEFDATRWETWYRFAQTFDTQIDEYTTWTAEKLENEQGTLIDLQRTAILCYIMAVAAAKRCEDGSEDHDATVASLYTDFGIRLYASTREPFNGRVFQLDGFKRQFNGVARGMYEDVPFKPVSVYSVWKFASVLLRQAAQQRPRDWYIPYMLGKILWKMHNHSRETHPPVHFQLAIDAIVQAIRCLPEKRDSRHSDKDPILEPHYKLVSMVHKLVRPKRTEKAIDVERACHILKATPYARKIPDVQEAEDWEQYILAVLKAMRSADKSNWHHRMVVRAAHILYDENPNDMLAVLGAKHELSQQIFTKTMTIQVWKPDNERAGRHFVYTGRYVLFFADLLVKTNDKENMDMLARRIRRKAGDFVKHARIWHDYALRYLKLLRKSIPVSEKYEESIFNNMNPEDFSQGAGRLETFALAPGTVCEHIDVLRESMEFKKLNNNLMDRNIIESLIADIYAWIYNRYVDELRAKTTAEENRVRMSVENILTNSAAQPLPPAPSPTETTGEQQGRGVRRQFSVTRRMVISKAEALIVKPPAIATPRAPQRALAPAPLSGQIAAVAVVIPQEGPNGVDATSVPGSIHDSADDESELSEVEVVNDPVTAQEGEKTPTPPVSPKITDHKVDDEDAESTTAEEGTNIAIKDDGEAPGEEIEPDFEEERAQPQGHVPVDGFGSSRHEEEWKDEDGEATDVVNGDVTMTGADA